MKDIFDAIAEYAAVYDKLESLQSRYKELLPGGDQKTGVIAEFYARIYAASAYPHSELAFGTTVQSAWGIMVKRSGQPDHKIQVKAVSGHSKTSRVSHIHPGWDELYLIRLDKTMYPNGFWVIRGSETGLNQKTIKATTMPCRGRPNSGSLVFHGADDQYDAFVEQLSAVSRLQSLLPSEQSVIVSG